MKPQPSSAAGSSTGMVNQAGHTTAASGDPLPSWNEGAAKASIVSFVRAATDAASPDYVRPEERIATFDNDGTLWAEQPYYFQLAFAIDRIKALAPRHPEWQGQEPFKSTLAGNLKSVFRGGAACAGSNRRGHAFRHDHGRIRSGACENGWRRRATRKTNRPYTDMVFQPMLEVLAYLRANDFKTFIVSGGGIEFMRTFAEQTYGDTPRAGDRQQWQAEVRDARRQPGSGQTRRDRVRQRERRQTRLPSKITSAAARSPLSAIRTATLKCCNGQPAVTGARLAMLGPPHRCDPRMGIRSPVGRRSSRSTHWMRPTRRVGQSWI